MIDSHVHIGKYDRWESDIGQLIKQMDEFGIKYAIASDMTINTYDSDGNVISADKTQIQLNEAALSMSMPYSDRIGLLFWIRPVTDAADTVLYNYLAGEKFVGLKVHPRTAGLAFSHKNYSEYIKICESLKLPFCIHTENDGFCDIEYVYEAAVKHPDVIFVAVHMNLGTSHEKAYQLIGKCGNLYGDTTLVDTADVLKAIEVCGPEKIMFGSDACIFGTESYSRYKGLYNEIASKFDIEAADKVFKNNAKRIFGR